MKQIFTDFAPQLHKVAHTSLIIKKIVSYLFVEDIASRKEDLLQDIVKQTNEDFGFALIGVRSKVQKGKITSWSLLDNAFLVPKERLRNQMFGDENYLPRTTTEHLPSYVPITYNLLQKT